MVDKKITQLAITEALDENDLLPLVVNTNTVPETKAVRLSKLSSEISANGFSQNVLINGGFDIAQRQNPKAATTIANGKYAADRWKYQNYLGDATYQVVNATGEAGLNCANYGKFTKTTTGSKMMIAQIVEGVNTIPLRGKTVTFQIKLKSSSNQSMRLALIESTGTIDSIPTIVSIWGGSNENPTLAENLNYVYVSDAFTTTSIWQQFSITTIIPGSSKNLIAVILDNSYYTVGQSLCVAEAGLYVGDAVRQWTPRPIAEELNMCKRYYENNVSPSVTITNGVARVSYIAWCYSSNRLRSAVRYETEKRINPTITYYRTSDGTDDGQAAYYSGAWTSATNTVTEDPSVKGHTIQITGSGPTVGSSYQLSVAWEADAEL